MPVSENCNIWITCESVSSIDFPWVFFFLVCCCLGFLFVFYFVLFSVLWSCFLICLIILYLNVWEILSVYNSTENFFFFFLEDRELRDHSDPGKVSLFLVSPCPSAWSSRSPKWKLQLITSSPHTHIFLNSNLSLLNTVTGEAMAPTPVLLPGKSHGRRSLVGCSPWGR